MHMRWAVWRGGKLLTQCRREIHMLSFIGGREKGRKEERKCVLPHSKTEEEEEREGGGIFS